MKSLEKQSGKQANVHKSYLKFKKASSVTAQADALLFQFLASKGGGARFVIPQKIPRLPFARRTFLPGALDKADCLKNQPLKFSFKTRRPILFSR